MRHKLLRLGGLALGLILVSGLMAGCGDDDGDCTSECGPVHTSQCSGASIQICEAGADSCLYWVDSTDCAATSQLCDDTGGPAACVANCANPCPSTNASQCSGTVVQSCVEGGDGCLGWVSGTDCADATQICDDSGAIATCVDGCNDDCTAVDDTQCNGSTIETCELGNDGCLDWIGGVNCATSSQICDDTSGDASCMAPGALWTTCTTFGTLALGVPSSPPLLPTGDTANDGSSSCWNESGGDIIAQYTATTTDPLLFTWSNVTPTTGTYRNYEIWRGSCDPAVGVEEYCDNVTASNDSVTINTVAVGDVFYMKAIAESSGADFSSATFQVDATACADPVAGSPTVTSSDRMYGMFVTADEYILTFNENVTGVLGDLTWASVTGSGTMGAATQLDAQTYRIPFSGVVPGDEYTLTVGTAATDECGLALAAPVAITITISTTAVWTGCSDFGDLTLGVATTPPQLPTGDTTNDGAGSCWAESGADLVARYTATTTDPLTFSWSNVGLVSGSYRNYELWRGSCDSATGDELYCTNTTSDAGTATVDYVDVGDVFYIKAIAETTGDDFTTATFQVDTATCSDPMSGAPTVTSGDGLYQMGTTSGTYTLSFREDVHDVLSSLTWTPVTGSGTMGTVTQVDAMTYTIPFSGAATGDVYTLTVGATVHDTCRNPLSAAVDITITISSTLLPEWTGCTDVGALILGSTISPPQLPTGDTTNSGSGSCYTENGADIIASYTATTTDGLIFTWNNVNLQNGTWRNYELWRGSCDPAVGTELHCNNSTTSGEAFTVGTVAIGDVFYMKAIAETAGDDFTSADFRVEIAPPPPPGGVCTDAIDLDAAGVPHTVTGQFDSAGAPGGSCDTTADNAVWYSYTPGTTGWYTIDAANTETASNPYSRIAVFETTTCSPLGTEVACGSTAANTIHMDYNYLTAGTTYLIVFYTDGVPYFMVDPTINIQPGPAPPDGEMCSSPATLSSTNHTVDGNSHDCWTWTADSNNSIAHHTFTCDPATGGDMVVEFTTGAADTTLEWTASIANYETSGYIGVEVMESPCASGTSLYCTAGSSTQDANTTTVTGSTTYYVWISDAYDGHHLPDINLCLWSY